MNCELKVGWLDGSSTLEPKVGGCMISKKNFHFFLYQTTRQFSTPPLPILNKQAWAQWRRRYFGNLFFSPSLSLHGQVLIMICGFSVAKALISSILVFNTVIDIQYCFWPFTLQMRLLIFHQILRIFKYYVYDEIPKWENITVNYELFHYFPLSSFTDCRGLSLPLLLIDSLSN